MTLTPHLPILQVVVPLFLAPICALFKSGRLSWLVALIGSWASLFIAGNLLAQVIAEGDISYAVGGWLAPWGIEYRVDEVNAFVLFIVCTIAAIVVTYAKESVEHEISSKKIPLFYSAYLLCLTGLLGITITGDAFNVFVFLEISSLSSYALIAMGKDRRALTAAFQYLIMGTIGATFILIGIGLLYMMTGTLNMADLAVRIPAVADTTTIHGAFAFLTIGIALKIALFPLHLWLPNAYTYAPSVVSAFLAATATKVSVYLLLRFFFTIFGAEFSFETMQLDRLLIPLSVAAIIVASISAIFQTDIKRILAYSSVAQIGYMTMGISLVSVTGLTAAIVHLFNHAAIKGGLFLALGCLTFSLGTTQLKKLQGAGKQAPWTFAAIVAGGLSLIGIPLTVGFISKWYLAIAIIEQQQWVLLIVIGAGSLLAVVYMWRIIETLYFKPQTNTDVREAPLSLLGPTWVLIGINFYFGINSTLTSGVASLAASNLLGLAP